MQPHERIFCAFDMTDADRAVTLAKSLKGSIGGVKLGMEFFYALGRDGYARVAATGLPIFLDLKLHDIPNTVAKGLTSLMALAPAILTIHTQNGAAGMRAAADAVSDAANTAGVDRPTLVGVTVLTSLDRTDLVAMGVASGVEEQVVRLASLAQEAGLDGVVCSPREISAIRARCGDDFSLVVPGIRPAGTALDDQKRVMTPHAAVAAGATHLVIGRPITGADDPARAARAIAAGLEG